MAQVKAVIAVCSLVLMALAWPAHGRDDAPLNETTARTRLQALQQQMDDQTQAESRLQQEMADITAGLTRLSEQLVGLTTALRRNEQTLFDLNRTLAVMEAEENTLLDNLAQQKDRMSAVGRTLLRLSSIPTEGLIFFPDKPEHIMQGSLLMRSALESLMDDVDALRDDLETLEQVRRQIRRNKEQTEQVTTDLERERTSLSDLMAARRKVYAERENDLAAARRTMEELAQSSASVQELLARLEADRLERQRQAALRPVPQRDALDAAMPRLKPERGTRVTLGRQPDRMVQRQSGTPALLFPVAGRITRDYGVRDDSGVQQQGLTITTPDSAVVIAPTDGQVMFAGPFRGFANLVIIEHHRTYHTLLAGLSDIDVPVGQDVLAGEPVGTMPDRDGRLYLEIRKKGEPQNPLTYLQSRAAPSQRMQLFVEY